MDFTFPASSLLSGTWQILFYGVSATLAAVLNARGRFAPPMRAPVASNPVVIVIALVSF